MNSPATELQRFTTLRLTAHLWRRVEGRYGVMFESKCGRLYESQNELEPFMEGDKMCAKCFPPDKQFAQGGSRENE